MRANEVVRRREVLCSTSQRVNLAVHEDSLIEPCSWEHGHKSCRLNLYRGVDKRSHSYGFVCSWRLIYLCIWVHMTWVPAPEIVKQEETPLLQQVKANQNQVCTGRKRSVCWQVGTAACFPKVWELDGPKETASESEPKKKKPFQVAEKKKTMRFFSNFGKWNQRLQRCVLCFTKLRLQWDISVVCSVLSKS